MIAPVFASLAAENKGKVTFVKVRVCGVRERERAAAGEL
jgi:hypothetical protein